MLLELIIGFVLGLLLILAGYFVQTQKAFVFLAGFGDTWEPVNKGRLGKRVGVLLSILGIIVILTSIFTIWFGSIAGKISAILAVIDIILILAAIVLDRMGF